MWLSWHGIMPFAYGGVPIQPMYIRNSTYSQGTPANSYKKSKTQGTQQSVGTSIMRRTIPKGIVCWYLHIHVKQRILAVLYCGSSTVCQRKKTELARTPTHNSPICHDPWRRLLRQDENTHIVMLSTRWVCSGYRKSPDLETTATIRCVRIQAYHLNICTRWQET